MRVSSAPPAAAPPAGEPYAVTTRDTVPRLRGWIGLSAGTVPMARCRHCAHLAALPLATLLRRFDPATPLSELGARMVCSRCGGRRIELRTMRLCDPACPKQRG